MALEIPGWVIRNGTVSETQNRRKANKTAIADDRENAKVQIIRNNRRK